MTSPEAGVTDLRENLMAAGKAVENAENLIPVEMLLWVEMKRMPKACPEVMHP